MDINNKTSRLNRRRFIRSVAAVGATTGFALAAPAIIGRAGVASAKNSFAGENLIVVSWSGNYERVFRETVIEPFNAEFGTKAETIGGWDQIVSQIQAAPADNPPFDITVTDEYVASAGLAGELYVKTDRAAIPNLEAVYPWFHETRPQDAAQYGIPFGGGSAVLLVRNSIGVTPDSWKHLWGEKLAGRITLDSGAWWYTLAIPAILKSPDGRLDAMYNIKTAEPLIAELERLKVAKWFTDGAEQANLLVQEEADAAMSYSSDTYTFLREQPGEYVFGVPREGTPAWAEWYMKVRGTKHGELADLFMNYLLAKETQERFLANSMQFVARSDVQVPDHWNGYPASNEDYHRMFQVITMQGWDGIMADYQAFDDRMKQVIVKTTG